MINYKTNVVVLSIGKKIVNFITANRQFQYGLCSTNEPCLYSCIGNRNLNKLSKLLYCIRHIM